MVTNGSQCASQVDYQLVLTSCLCVSVTYVNTDLCLVYACLRHLLTTLAALASQVVVKSLKCYQLCTWSCGDFCHWWQWMCCVCRRLSWSQVLQSWLIVCQSTRGLSETECLTPGSLFWWVFHQCHSLVNAVSWSHCQSMNSVCCTDIYCAFCQMSSGIYSVSQKNPP